MLHASYWPIHVSLQPMHNFLKPCIVASIRYNADTVSGCIGGIGRKLGYFHFGHDLGGGSQGTINKMKKIRGHRFGGKQAENETR
ncbi:hypothetical protein PSHT_07260 [Puccinia striiformis]|uniref:Uncharacterized protein n=1 Tax=Puccinia striiformis TaxID=27350 RepID=A0A2S4VZE6_9BASI|nr:hypothetical protein PSHT_07260 [Puccinia striiformis]